MVSLLYLLNPFWGSRFVCVCVGVGLGLGWLEVSRSSLKKTTKVQSQTNSLQTQLVRLIHRERARGVTGWIGFFKASKGQLNGYSSVWNLSDLMLNANSDYFGETPPPFLCCGSSMHRHYNYNWQHLPWIYIYIIVPNKECFLLCLSQRTAVFSHLLPWKRIRKQKQHCCNAYYFISYIYIA